VGPDEARVRRHLNVATEERHWLSGGRMRHHKAVCAACAKIGLIGDEGYSKRLWEPPLLEQLGRGPRLEHDARRAVEGSRDHQLALGLSIHPRFVLHGVRSLSLLVTIDLLFPLQFLDNLV